MLGLNYLLTYLFIKYQHGVQLGLQSAGQPIVSYLLYMRL